MKASAFLITLLFLSAYIPGAFAQTKNNINVHTDSQDSNVNVKINNQLNTGNNYSQTNSSNNSTQINISQSEGDTQVSINNNDFKISGRVDSTSGEEFTIANQKIIKDNLTSMENSLIVVENVIKATGTIKSGLLYANHVELLNSNPPASKPSSSITPKPSLDPSSSPTLNLTPEPSALDNVRINISGPIDHISTIIQEIIKFLRNLAS